MLICHAGDSSGSFAGDIHCPGTVPGSGGGIFISGAWTGNVSASASDSSGSIPQVPGTLGLWNGSGASLQWYVLPNASSGSDTFTITFSGSGAQYPDINVYYVSGVSTTSPTYAGRASSADGGSSVPTCNSTTIRNAGDEVLAYGVSTVGAITAGSGYTLLSGFFTNQQNEYQIFGSTGSTTPIFGVSTSSSHTGCSSLVLTNTPTFIASPPVITPASGRLGFAQNITITCPVGSNAAYYTTDGSTPSTGSTLYTAPFLSATSGSETVKGICAQAGYVTSTVTTNSYTISAATHFIRADGGTSYTANVSAGQCDGLADVGYPGTGTNQHCAYNDFRYLWDDDSGIDYHGLGWFLSNTVGGDTIVVRGCHALTGSSGQQNPSNPNCRIGWDQSTSTNWCKNEGGAACGNPPIPAGGTSQHTRILGSCAYDGSCTPIDNHYPYTTPNETQLFAGFGLKFAINVQDTANVDFAGLELTTHNGQCTINGSPSYHYACSTNSPFDDFGDNGFQLTSTSVNISFTDVYDHGFIASGFFGPLGGVTGLTRVFSGFNGTSGWNFDDGASPYSTQNATGSEFIAHYLTLIGNGCYEQYPIVNPQFPAVACYDDQSSGFGDALSGQTTLLDTMICDHCYIAYNTKDAYIGPHVQVLTDSITNSFITGNSGASVKVGTQQNGSFNVINNLIVGDCGRMSETVPGASQNFASVRNTQIVVSGGVGTFTVAYYVGTPQFTSGESVYIESFGGAGAPFNNKSFTVISSTPTSFTASVTTYGIADGTYTDTGQVSTGGAWLSNFCRAAGNTFADLTRANTVNNISNNTIVFGGLTGFLQDCGYYRIPDGTPIQENNCGTSPILTTNNTFIGYNNTGTQPGLYFKAQASVVFTGAYNIEYGIRNGDTCGGTIICSDPLLVNEVAQPFGASQAATFDNYIPYLTGNSFGLTSGSPAVHAGTPISGITTDYYGATRPNPPSIGGVEYGGSVTSYPVWGGGASVGAGVVLGH